MSRTERKLRQALVEIEALRADRPKMQETITILTSANFEMRSALREAEIVITEVHRERVTMLPKPDGEVADVTVTTVTMDPMVPWRRVTALDFVLKQIRAALGRVPT